MKGAEEKGEDLEIAWEEMVGWLNARGYGNKLYQNGGSTRNGKDGDKVLGERGGRGLAGTKCPLFHFLCCVKCVSPQ